MSERPGSPISQLLSTLGISREQLEERSLEMRRFLSAGGSFLGETPSERPPTAALGSTWLSQQAASQASSDDSSARESSTPSISNASLPQEPQTPKSQTSDGKQGLSMEMVIERQRRNSRKERRTRRDKDKDGDRASLPHPSSPSPRDASLPPRQSDDAPTASTSTRPDASEEREGSHPYMTPQQSKYYRPHTALSGPPSVQPSGSGGVDDSSEQASEAQRALQTYLEQALGALAQQKHPFPPVTPSKPSGMGLPSSGPFARDTPLPPSSPPQRSPSSSPTRPINLVSSPGPMGPPPKAEDYLTLPYNLPPGPYSSKKPEYSYAAMIGQAILSSPEHRLTLQEIYDWITVVYPYYKRGESTWMNSIRHVLSTTVTFRKVPRDRSVGRTLWAIWDEDIPCFSDGGFKKHLCKDYTAALAAKGQPTSASKSKSRARKRDERDEPEVVEARPPKKSRKQTEPSSSALPGPVSYGRQSRTIFGPSGTTTNHQSYYDACLATASAGPMSLHPLPGSTGVLLPPLMASSSQRLHQSPGPTSAAEEDIVEENSREIVTTTPQSAERSQLREPIPSSSASTSSRLSVPELTPHRESSSPPPSYPDTSDADIDEYLIVPDEDEDELGYPGESNSFHDIVPGSLLQDEETAPYENTIKHRLAPAFDSPSASRRRKEPRAMTPPPELPPALPCTPPKFRGRGGEATSSKVTLSPHSTPLSHKGLYMSPSTSLAHYKSNLDPPPALRFGGRDGQDDPEVENDQLAGDENMRTPRTRSARNAGNAFSITPRRLPFPSAGSPYRTPNTRFTNTGGLSSISPWRGPLLDPYDASMILDDELRRSKCQDSPMGLLGKRSNLLYQSPSGFGASSDHDRWY